METNLIEASFREQQRYSFEDFRREFDNKIGLDRAKGIIHRLKARHILKQVKKKEEKDLSELVEEDISDESLESEEVDKFFVFTFVGILWVDGCIIKCYPKYASKEKCDLAEVFKVLRKYNRKADKEIIHLYNDRIKNTSFNILAVMLYFLVDYHENGLYTNERQIIETNGAGDILWERTINDTFAVLQNGRPFYMELKTRRRILDEGDYFRRLHQSILGICSHELKEKGILDIFGLTESDESVEELGDFGDENYICYRIENELNVQFNTRKRLLLQTMYAFVKNESSMQLQDNFSMFGTNAFHVVWEDVCKKILQDQLEVKKKPLPKDIDIGDKKNLKEYIEKPCWQIDGVTDDADTFIPDLITINGNEKYFAIFDAKYYHVQAINGKISGQPGIESVSKQFMYEHAYKKIVPEGWGKYNAFLFPVQNTENLFEHRGEVKMEMFCDDMGLSPIQVVFVNPKKAYEIYLKEGNAVKEIGTIIKNCQNKTKIV